MITALLISNAFLLLLLLLGYSNVFTDIRRDAQNECFIIKRIDDTGADISAGDSNYRGEIRLKLGECLGSDGNYHAVYVQETEICVGGTTKRCMLPRSAVFDPPP